MFLNVKIRSKLNFDFFNFIKELEQVEAKKYFLLKEKRKKQVLFENVQTLKSLKQTENSIINELLRIAEQYLKYNLKVEACECYLRSKQYSKAAELYIAMEMWNEAAEMYYMQKDYKKSAELYEKINDYLKMMESYENLHDYESILRTINQYREIIPNEDRIEFLKKYFPIALEKLVNNVDFEEPELNVSKQKKKKGEEINAIEEEEDENYDSDELLSEESEEVSIKSEKEEKIIEKESLIEESIDQISKVDKNIMKSSEQRQIIENDSSIDQSLDFDKISHKPKEISIDIINKNKQNESICEVINNNFIADRDKSFEKVGFEFKQQSLDDDHFSQIDFDDEWLKSENHSIIGSILSSRENKIEVKSEYSGFECLNTNNLNPHFQIIKTKGDIFVQDETMKKIIEYLKTFADDFSKHVEEFRSKAVLLTSNKIREEEHSNENFVMELDNIDISFLYMALDVLETYNQYKLCIFVCNRYSLNHRVGRYLLSIAHRYSFLSNEQPPNFNYSLFFGDGNKFMKNQKEKAFIVSTAIHNVLENINPRYLQFKSRGVKADDSNDLGNKAFQGLIWLGCWKKCLFFMDFERALTLAEAFGDFESFKFLFLRESGDKIEFNSLESVKEKFDSDFLKVCLKERILKGHQNIKEEKLIENFELNAIIFDVQKEATSEKTSKLKKMISDCLGVFKKIERKKEKNLSLAEELKVFDLVTGIVQFANNLHNNEQGFTIDDNEVLVEVVDFLVFLIEFLEKSNHFSKYSMIILDAVLTCFG